MRILVNTRFLLKGKLEGFGIYTYEVVSRLVRNYPEHEFFFAFDRPYDPDFVFAENVHPLVINPPARHPLLFWWWFEVAIPRAYQRHKCDAFFSPDGFTSLSAKIAHNVMTIHDLAYLHYPTQISWMTLRFYRAYMPKFIAAADQIVTVSLSTQQDLLEHFPNARGKTTWVHNGIQTTYKPLSDSEILTAQNKWSGGHAYFIVIGAIHPRKNIPNTIRAYEHFRKNTDSQTKLLLVGRAAWQTDDVRTQLNQSPFQKDMISTGYIPHQELVTLLAGARALVYVSLLEGFGLPIAEAMQCGVPVITSNRSSMQEIAKNCALLVDPENVEDIAQGMGKLDADATKRAQLISAGLERAKDFDWDSVADHVAATLFG